jgi:hypothetical protein
LDVDSVTGELIADVLVREVLANFDLEQFAALLQVGARLRVSQPVLRLGDAAARLLRDTCR